MKKLVKKIVVLAAVAAMGLSMIACGKKFSSVADYVKSDEVKEVLTETRNMLEGTGMSIDIKADGDKMVYTYKYDSIEKADLSDAQISALESGVEAENDTFQDSADELKKLVKADSPSVVLEYVDANNEVIYSKEFTAK